MPPPEFRIVCTGERLMARNIDGIARRGADARPVFEDIYYVLLDIIDEMFDKQGARRPHPKWHHLDPTYKKWKEKHGGHPSILQFTSDMKQSLIQYKSPDVYVRIEKDKIVFSPRKTTEIGRKAGWHFKGIQRLGRQRKGRLPARPWLFLNLYDKRSFARAISTYVHRGKSGMGV